MSEKTKDQLLEENAALKEKLAKSQEALKVAEATKPKNAKPVVKINGDHYEVLGGELLNGKRTTRDELAKNEARCKELVATGSALLRKVKI